MTSNRWVILAVLFLARLTMAFQFQSVAALSPLLVEDFGVGLADIGFLIGLYFAPGIVFALPGGAIAARFGDKRVVGLGMVLMLAGGAMIAMTESWNVLTVGRLVVGVGGVILNVVTTKMVVDWFAGKELSTAMAIFINSWPVGIALALVVLPVLAKFAGVAFAWLARFCFSRWFIIHPKVLQRHQLRSRRHLFLWWPLSVPVWFGRFTMQRLRWCSVLAPRFLYRSGIR